MKYRFKIFFHASIISALAAVLLLSGCSRSFDVPAAQEESQCSPAKQEASNPAKESWFLHPVTKEYLSSVYSEDGSALLCRTSSFALSLRENGYEALRDALSRYSSQCEEALNRETELLRETAEKQMAVSPEEFRPYEITNAVNICRADQKVFSFQHSTTSNTGGAHSGVSVKGYTFDSQTGKQLALEDVASDRDGLYEYLVSCLENDERQEELFKDWRETVRRNVYGETSDGSHRALQWTLTSDGMNVYFDPYEIGPWSMGTITVSVPYGQKPAGISTQWIPMQEKTVWQLSPCQDFALDINGDGKNETIYYSQQQNNSMEMSCTLSVNEQTMEMACGYGITRSYIMKNPEGGFYFYADCSSDNDCHFLNIVDLSRLEQNGSLTEPAVFHMTFYDDVPMDSGSFWLSCPGTLFSTFPVRKEFSMGVTGLPEASEADFTVDRQRIVTRQDVTAYTGASFQEKCVLPKGTELFVTSTDEISHITAETADNTSCRFLLDGTEWPRTIDGTDIQELFDGLIFAG